MSPRREKGLWWDRALSLVHGCTPVSEGCARCWSAAASHMRASNPHPAVRARNVGLTAGKPPHFNGVVRLDSCPLKKLASPRVRPAVWAVWNDLFHEDVPEEFRDRAFAAFALSPGQAVVILTKRPDAMSSYLDLSTDNREHAVEDEMRLLTDGVDPGTVEMPFPSVWLGTSAENQERLDERMPPLMDLAAAGWNTFVSLEPLLGPVDVTYWAMNAFRCKKGVRLPGFPPHYAGLGAVIVGGETGSGARPMHPDWVRAIRDQCAEAGTPFFFKSWGDWAPWAAASASPVKDDGTYLFHDGSRSWGRHKDYGGYAVQFMRRIGRSLAGRLLDGRTHEELPWGTP